MTSEAAKPTSIASPYVDGLRDDLERATVRQMDFLGRIAKLERENAELVEALREALLQLEYLHQKFTPTSTGEAVISRLNGLLKRLGSA